MAGNISFLRKIYSLELASALEYRFSFFTQVFAMFLNDLFWIFFWFLLFERFTTVGNYHFTDMVLFQSFLALSFGIIEVCFANRAILSKLIESGSLDYYLTLPKNELLHILIRCRTSGFGDLLYGLVLALIILPWHVWPLYLLLLFFSALVMLSWSILVHSIGFFVNRFEGAARVVQEGFLSLAFYPFGVYKGGVRFILLFVIPAGFVAGIPVEVIHLFSFKWLGITAIVSSLFFLLALAVFYKGLKKYESGNVMVMRG